jgi:hypothetical protein
MDWTFEEFGTADLGDARLLSRLTKLASDFSQNPEKSIPARCRSWAETKAAYRFFDNEKVTSAKIHKPHIDSSLMRMQGQPVILMVQDTTTLNYTGQKERNNSGPTIRNNTKGMLLHPTLAITPERLCLGVIDYEQWFRPELANKTPKERSHINHLRKPSDKESYRWVRSYQKANEYAAKLPNTIIVSVADREGDLFELYQEARQTVQENNAHWLIRASYDRRLTAESGKIQYSKLIETVKLSGEKGKIRFHLGARPNKPARDIEQLIYFDEVYLSPTPRQRRNYSYEPVKTSVVIASEINVPKDEQPIEWVLLTSLPVESLEAACKIIEWYQCRWQIEIYFKILKSGCKIEKLQIAEDKRFRPCLALYMIVAWRILYITMLGRECPDVSCEIVFDKTEWQTAYIVLKRKKPPKDPPPLNEMIKLFASLGGFLNRSCDKNPGPGALWKGLKDLHEHVKAREAFESVFGHTYG